jgi:hypothetical protein
MSAVTNMATILNVMLCPKDRNELLKKYNTNNKTRIAVVVVKKCGNSGRT